MSRKRVRRTQVLREPTNSLYIDFRTANNAVISRNGFSAAVHITPEAVEVVRRYGFKVELIKQWPDEGK